MLKGTSKCKNLLLAKICMWFLKLLLQGHNFQIWIDKFFFSLGYILHIFPWPTWMKDSFKYFVFNSMLLRAKMTFSCWTEYLAALEENLGHLLLSSYILLFPPFFFVSSQNKYSHLFDYIIFSHLSRSKKNILS